MPFKTNHGGGSATNVIEMPAYDQQDSNTKNKTSIDNVVRTMSNRSNDPAGRSIHEDSGLPTSSSPSEDVLQWNHPRINIARTGAAFWAFVVLGMNDAAYGVCVFCLQILLFRKMLKISHTGFDSIRMTPPA